MASLVRTPLPQVRRALARRQRVRLRTRLAALQRLLGAALAGPFAGTAAGRRIAAAFVTFRRGLSSHLRAESWVLRGRNVGQRTLDQMVREHQRSEENIDALWNLLPAQVAGVREPAILRQLRVAVDRMETALHEQICAEHEGLFRRLRGRR